MLLGLKDVDVTYSSKEKEIKALNKISFKVEKGDFFSIIGPSGCGKTTILRAIAELIKITRGKINRPKDFKVAYVFQEPALLKWRNAIDNVVLPLELKGIAKDKAYEKARSILNMLDLDGFENVYPNDLSGGMKHRVAIARALISDPEILLMDEPFGALDEPTRLRLNIELNKIWRKTKKTVIFVTHNISEAVFLSNKIAILSKRPAKLNKIVEIDLPKERTLEILDSEIFVKTVLNIRKSTDLN